MLKRPSEHRLTLEERVAVVVAIAIAVGAHLVILLGGGGISQFARQPQKRERRMVVRRMREVTPAPEIAVRVPDPRRVQVSAEPAAGDAAGGAPPKPEPKVTQPGSPPPKAEVAPITEEPPASVPAEEIAKPAEHKGEDVGASSVSVVTDLPAATFTISGPAEYRGTGTFWIRRGAPAGTYRVSFNAVDGFSMPPPQIKELPEKGQIVFVGKYRRSTEVVIGSNVPGAQITIFRPDGRPLDLSRPGRALIDDLPPGKYTAVFKDVPGYATPNPASYTLIPGGQLSFHGEYKAASGGRTGGEAGKEGAATAGRGGRSGAGSGIGSAAGSGSGKPQANTAAGPKEVGLDRRVQIVVTSYPPAEIEEEHPAIPYPELIIRKSNFQQGWCQVYMVLQINDNGEVVGVNVERPRAQEHLQYEPLIKAVEESVRAWDYDTVRAEVHVDVRFYVE